MISKMRANRSARVATIFAAPFLVMSVAMMPTASMAAGGGDSGTTTTKKKLKCKKGFVLHKTKKKCVRAKKSSSLDQESIFEYGRNLAYAGRYGEAIDVLKLAPEAKDHRVLNMLGYSSRKSGNLDIAFDYYYASIAVNSDYSLVREYLGEAYLQAGKLEMARAQLSQIERICGSRSCDEYGQLAKLIIKSQS